MSATSSLALPVQSGIIHIPGGTVVPELANIHKTFGALQIGCLVAVFLFGIVTVQCHAYYSQFRDDRKLFKALVAVVWVLELAHTISMTYEVYAATIIHYGKPQDYNRYTGLGLATILGGSITMCVQSFFAFRLYSVLPSPWRHIGLLCIFLTAGRCIVSFYAGIEGILTTSLVEYTHKYRGMLAALFISGAAIDVVIAVVMLWFLVDRREQAMARVVRLLDRLVAWTVGTGLLTSVAAVVIAIMFMVQDTNLIWLALYTFLAKLYSNSLLSALNARATLRDTMSKGDSVSMSRNRHPPRGANHAISIAMKTTTQMEVDGQPIYNVPLEKHNLDSPSETDSGKGSTRPEFIDSGKIHADTFV